MPALIVVVAILIAVVAIVALRQDDPYQAAARNLGLNLTRTVPDLLPRLEGMINGLPVRIEMAEKGGPGLHYTVFYPPLGMALRLERETNITRTLGQLGEQDTQVGARAFDDSFRINTSRPDVLREMMTADLRRALVNLIEEHPKLVVADGSITLATDTIEPTAEEITETIAAMAAAAHKLVSRRPPPLQRRAIRPAPQQPTPAEPSPPPAATIPESPGPKSVSEEAPTPAPLPAEPEPAAPPSTGLPSGFFDEAFGANRLSFESSDEFDTSIKGTRVRLTGTIKQARDEPEDAVTKVTITVARIDSDLYGATDIDAIVELPSGTAAALERGTEVSFTGTIDGIDAFMRNLFVSGAELVS